MIKHKTVLVLGAGASLPYNFPTTEDLRLKILSLAKNFTLRDSTELDVEINQVVEFFNSFYYSGTYSIDEFLGKREEFTKIGKLLIAKSLLAYENAQNLFSFQSSRDWYKILVQSLTEDVSLDHLAINNSLTIITFNYDRSLEQYLFLALKNQFGAEENEVAQHLSKLNIIHLHGQLGYLPWQSIEGADKKVEYMNGLDPERIKEAANGIKIIYETDFKLHEFERAISAIEYAETVLFLGFGYHPLNLKRLSLSGNKGGRYVGGTALGLGNIQIQKAVNDSNNTLQRHNLYQDYDILKLFNERYSLT